MEYVSQPRLPPEHTKAWFELLRDHLMEPDVSPTIAATRLRVTRNTVIGIMNRAIENPKSKLRLVCTEEQWRTILTNRERRARGPRTARVPKNHVVALDEHRAPPRPPAGQRGGYGRNRRPSTVSRPPRETAVDPSTDTVQWASHIERALTSSMPDIASVLEPCCYPTSEADGRNTTFCGKHSVVRLFGGRAEMPSSVKALGTPVFRYCVLHTHAALGSVGKAAFERALRDAVSSLA